MLHTQTPWVKLQQDPRLLEGNDNSKLRTNLQMKKLEMIYSQNDEEHQKTFKTRKSR